MNLEDLNKRIDENAQKIISNLEKIETNAGRIQQNSYALDILKDYKSGSKRLFVVLIIVLFMWFATIGYLVYVLNDIGTEEITQETETYDMSTENGSNNYVGGDNNGTIENN